MDALDVAGTWYEAKVVDERSEGTARELLVHYNGWKARYDEWVGVGSGRLRAAGCGHEGGRRVEGEWTWPRCVLCVMCAHV